MKFLVKTHAVESFRTDGLVLGVFEKELSKGAAAAVDKALGGYMNKTVKASRFEGKAGQAVAMDTLGRIPAGRVILVGLGKEKELKEETVRKAAAKGAKAMRQRGIRNYATDLAAKPLNKISVEALAQAVTEGTALALYIFEQLKTEKSKKKIDSVTLLTGKKTDETAVKKGVKKGETLAECACFTRDLINLPGNIATPTYLGDRARELALKFGLKCSVLSPKQIEKLGMGGLMAVSRGSGEPARFIVLEWMKGGKGKKPVVLVGKGLTFDTGGISLKPSLDMHEMKSDMSGGAAVLGAMRAVARLKLKANVVGLVPTTENMPGGAAIKPGDVVTGLSGVTMEILNTDAEGRLILSDALAYSARYKPDCVVDMATLTGACMIALGSHAAGLFGTDDKLTGLIRECGERTGERVWPLPLWPSHEKDIESDVADIKNIGPRGAGASTAAAFLKKHVKGKWAHVDIAGVAFNKKGSGYVTGGAAGFGVRLMIDFIEKRAKPGK